MDVIPESTASILEKGDRPSPPLYFFEVWEDATNQLQMRNGTVPYAEMEQWLNLQNDYFIASENGKGGEEVRMILRLIACDFGRHFSELGCGHSNFQAIRNAFSLHVTSEEAIVNNNGAFGRYFTRAGLKEIDSFALVLKVANCVNIGYDALSMSYSLEAKTTRAFVHGLVNSEIERLIHYLQKWRSKSFYEQPLLLPALIYQSYGAKAEVHRASTDNHLHRTEVQVGYAIPGRLQERPLRNFREISLNPENLEFESITRRLHSCSTELGAVIHAGRFGQELGQFLLKTARELQDLQIAPANGESIRHWDSLVHQIEFSTNLYSSLLSQASVLKERVQSHINLTFSLIAQDENRISRSVAEESAMIAVASKRDSAAMKTIAVLTTIFLPPTFVATFFSMTMFNWTPESPSMPIASKYIWVYWAVAIPLTVVVLTVWRVWWTLDDKKYQHALRNAKQERSKPYPLKPTQFSEYEKAAFNVERSEHHTYRRREAEQRRTMMFTFLDDGTA